MLPSAWASLKAEWARVVAARRGPKVRVDVGEEMEPLAEALAGVCAARARRVRARRHCKRLPQAREDGACEDHACGSDRRQRPAAAAAVAAATAAG